MEYTELSAYDLPPGVVTTWTPATDAACWQQDPRAISPSHEQHLAQGETGSWIGGVMRIPAPLVAETLIRTLRAWYARHEALRADVVREDDAWKRRIVAAQDITVDHVVHGEQDSASVHETIADYFTTVSPLAWPHCVFATVATPGDEGFTLAFGADHSVMDAYSQLLWFDEIASLYGRAAAGESDAALAVTGSASYLDHAHDERGSSDRLTADAPAVERWRAFLSSPEYDGLAFPAFPGLGPVDGPTAEIGIPRPRGVLRQASFSTPLADAEQTHVFNQLCKAGGSSLQNGVFAAMAHVLQQQHGINRLRFVVPMHTRMSIEHATAVGWYVGLCPVDVDLAEEKPLSDLLGHVHSEVSANRDLVPHPFARIMELTELEEGPKFAVSYIDGRFIPGADSWDEWQGRALRSPAYADDEVYLWFGRQSSGLNVSARYPETVAAEHAMRDMVSGISRLIDEITASVRQGVATA